MQWDEKKGARDRKEREGEHEGDRGVEFLCGLHRDELECSNVRETANPHLPFPRARAYAEITAGARGWGRDLEVRDRGGKTRGARVRGSVPALSAVLIPAIFN